MLRKQQWEVHGGGNPEGTATHARGRVPLRELLVPQGRDAPEGMMAHVRGGWQPALLRDQSRKQAIKPPTAEDTVPPPTSFAPCCLLNLRSLAGLSVTHSKTKRN